MQIVETTNEGLKRAYTLTITAKDIDAKIDAEVKKVAPQVRMPGFRPGKVPANLVRKMHGDALHADVLNTTVRESVDGLIKDKKLRPALQPKVEMADGYEQGKDAELTVEVEVLPEIEAPSVDGLKLEKLTVPVSDEQMNEALERIASGQKSYKDAAKTKKAADGDQLIIDFVGSIDGEEFEGGKAEDAPLVIGSGQFIPGFEEQLTGVKTGDEKTITVTFPEDYPAEHLAGKDAQFAVTVKQVKVETESKIDDEFAKGLGLESLEQLTGLIKDQLKGELDQASRSKAKRDLLDRLDEAHSFDLPPNMVEAEFGQIWDQLQREMDAGRVDDADKEKSEDDLKKEYRDIAERRVRLGLVLAEIGRVNDVKITEQEVQQALIQEARQYPGQEREVIEFFQKNPNAMAQLRAPIYEDKVVDYILGEADVTDKTVSREELFKEDEE